MAEANWLEHLPEDDRDACLAELRSSAAEAYRSGSVVSLETCLREWRATALAVAEPMARAILLAEPMLGEAISDADFIQVGPPVAAPGTTCAICASLGIHLFHVPGGARCQAVQASWVPAAASPR